MKGKSSLLAAASLIGTIIGAGVFGIPYVMARSGVLTSLFYFLILGLVVTILHLLYGEIVLRTKGKHRIVGYTEKYLGKKAKSVIAVAAILGATGALLAYIILAGNFLNIIFPFLSPLQLSLITWAVLSFFVFLGIRSIAWSELLINIAFFAVIAIIFFLSFSKINLSNFSLFNKNYAFLPYGVILFSLIGWNAIPEIEGILFNKRNLKKVILWSSMITLGFSFLFGFMISGVTGFNTTPNAFQGLLPVLGQKIMILGGLFGLFAVATSFLVIGNYLKNTLRFDYKLPYALSFAIACFSPLVLFLVGFKEFILVIGSVGVLLGLVEGIAITLIYQKAKKTGERTPEYGLKIPRPLIYLTIAILIFGTVSHLLGFLG